MQKKNLHHYQKIILLKWHLNDVLGTPTGKTYNTDRLREFICKLRHGIPDKVRITIFGIDGPPKIAILEYNGKYVKYTSDVSRLREIEKFIEFYGTNVIAKPTMSRLVGLTDTFYIVTKEHGLVPIISDHSKVLF